MKFYSLFLLLTALLFMGCEKDFNVEYRIQNKTIFEVTIDGETMINNSTQILEDSKLISGASLPLGVESGSGMSTEEYLENLDNLIPERIKTLTIFNDLFADFKPDPTDPINWDVINPVDKDTPGFILLDLSTDDF